jgi:hypothetical protein
MTATIARPPVQMPGPIAAPKPPVLIMLNGRPTLIRRG